MNLSTDPATFDRREVNEEQSISVHIQGSIVAQSTRQVYTTSITVPRNSRPSRLAAFFNKEKRNPNRNVVDHRGDNPFHSSTMSTPIRFSTTSISNSTGSNHAYHGSSHFAHACSLAGNPIYRPTVDPYGSGHHMFGRSNIPVPIQAALVPLMNEETFPPLPKVSRASHRCSHPLDLPEMLLHILDFVADSNELYKCLFVNRMWKICATKVLWTQAKFTSVENAALFLSMFDTGTTVKSGDDNSNEQRVEPLAVLSTGLRSGDQRRSTEIPAQSEDPMRPIASNKVQSRRRISGKKRDGKHEVVSGPPHVDHARRMKKIVFYKLKTLGSALLISAAPQLHRLTFLEFYICDMITTAVVSEFAKHCPNLKDVRVPGCGKITDESIIQVAANCPKLQHLDVRACSLISDVSVIQIAHGCPELLHINVGRISKSERITYRSISEIAAHTKVDTLGLAGCDVTDNSVISIAIKRAGGLERVSFNNCPRITDAAVEALAKYCPRLAVLEIKECLCITNFGLIWQLLQKRVLVEMCGTGKARLDMFQRAELAKIKFGTFGT